MAVDHFYFTLASNQNVNSVRINHQQLYERLGNLFYAIAAADHSVRKTEEESLKEKINSIWVPMENSTDQFGTDRAHYIFISFDYLHAENADPEASFKQFEDFYRHHSAIMDDDVKKRILQTAEAIADSFSRVNKTELVYLDRLRKLLDE